MSAHVNSLGARAQVLTLVLIYERIFAFVLSQNALKSECVLTFERNFGARAHEHWLSTSQNLAKNERTVSTSTSTKACPRSEHEHEGSVPGLSTSMRAKCAHEHYQL